MVAPNRTGLGWCESTGAVARNHAETPFWATGFPSEWTESERGSLGDRDCLSVGDAACAARSTAKAGRGWPLREGSLKGTCLLSGNSVVLVVTARWFSRNKSSSKVDAFADPNRTSKREKKKLRSRDEMKN